MINYLINLYVYLILRILFSFIVLCTYDVIIHECGRVTDHQPAYSGVFNFYKCVWGGGVGVLF